MFNFKVYIYDYEDKEYKDYTAYAVFPPKFADLLDEQLDEAELQLRNVPVEVFQQQTPVRIVITEKAENPFSSDMVDELEARTDYAHNVSFNLDDKTLTEEITLNMLVATDRTFNSPRGLKNADNKLTYTHTLYLIERTKLLERFVGEGLTFTNALGNEWSSSNHAAEYSIQETSDPTILTYKKSAYYLSPYDRRTSLSVIRLDKFINDDLGVYYTAIFPSYIFVGAGVYITDIDGQNVYKQYLVANAESDYGFDVYEQVGTDSPVKLNNGAGLNTYNSANSWVAYSLNLTENKTLKILYTTCDPARINQTPPANRYAMRFDVEMVEDLYPLQKRTYIDVINRCFNLIEPLIGSQKPRFVLPDILPVQFYNIAPEYAMTRMTLREQLKLVGGSLHAEPRIIDQIAEADANGGWQYVVGFDMYGQTVESHIKDRYCVSNEAYADINDYATELDSSVENLVNQLDWAQGVVAEPFPTGDKTLRSETANVRLEDNENTFIQTNKPIYSLMGSGSVLYCGYGINNNGTVTWYDAIGTQNGTETRDITPYVFEETDYANTLSSYEGTYPYAKSYAIYYTQGEKGIKGLFFKQPRAVAPAYADYAIVNIIKAVGGTLPNSPEYPLLRFRVNYLPVVATRIKTHKAVKLNGTPSTIVYNQAANLVETKYYGENLKGVIARMGNVEKTKTFLLGHLSDIPKIGLLYDDNYYLSAVRWELRPKYIICTVGLSKDFNRLSEYVGISSNKRMWEISERQIQRRESIYNPKILISQTQYTSDGKFTVLDGAAKQLLNDTASYSLTGHIQTYDYDNNKLSDIVLPITSVPFGNSMIFTCQMDDNYSAGLKVAYNANENIGAGDSIVGWWTVYSPYNNYYGRFQSLIFGIANITGGTTPTGLPDATNATLTEIISAGAILYDKDSREIPQLTMELSAMSDDPRIIVGSALMGNCKLCNQNPSNYEIYLTDEKISPISSKADFTRRYDRIPLNYLGVQYLTINADGITVRVNGTFYPRGESEPRDTKAWAIITEPTTETITVARNDGSTTTQTIQKGGDIVLAGNFAPQTEYAEYTLYFNVINDLEKL